MNILGRLTVLPHLPSSLARLEELAHNLGWTWDPDARALFRELGRDLWEHVDHNPIVLLRDVEQARLDEKARDPEFLGHLERVAARVDAYRADPGWFGRAHPERTGDTYAYFCAEYGWHEGVALYSGGLGVLAGDHTKAASDLGVPLVAVGLWYPEGYFHQRVAADGRQEAVYARRSPFDLALEPVIGEDGVAVHVRVNVFGREVVVAAWRTHVGRVPVVLLDVDLPENHPDDRALLARLYGGDQRTRIAQEIVLGVGGVRMLRAIGVAPTSWHMNEGHSAFMALERCRELVAEGMPFDQAREAVAAGTVFTVHTPVAAGNDAFPFDLVTQAFGGYWGHLGLRQQDFLELGRADHGWGPVFSMPALALRFTTGRNGVAKLHGETSRRMWSELWPGVPEDEVPIGHVTNGVHTATWMAPQVASLLDEILPDDWCRRLDDIAMWDAAPALDPAALWRARQDMKGQSVRFLRRRVRRQLDRLEASPTDMADVGELFDSEALTIGFARRFATYKRATLIFRDLDRLERLLTNPERPVQLVFAGKAHPADQEGQQLIQTIQRLSADPRFRGRVLFVEDYDMAVGRALTRGADVWLNNPRRPLEASGTSGQKAGMNGVLNLSVLDGWWPEGYDGANGWAIGGERAYGDEARADAADADELYALLEREVVPLYYARDAHGVPVGWMKRSARAIFSVTPRFNAQRMVKDYLRAYYMPASERSAAFAADDYALAADLAAWRKEVAEHWPTVYFQGRPAADGVRQVGEPIEVEAVLNPRGLRGKPMVVEVVYGLEADGLQHSLHRVPMTHEDTYPDGGERYVARFRPAISGRLAYGVRAYPTHPGLANPFDGLALRWG
ncbi:MAG: alpha-glucan family phosphorylase [Trueperaceae bacterium]|nr:alpha-glucan family phosphorylase [Trueperaceae bacterium]